MLIQYCYDVTPIGHVGRSRFIFLKLGFSSDYSVNYLYISLVLNPGVTSTFNLSLANHTMYTHLEAYLQG